jgi:SAM-dependent methyltransferase
MTAPWWQTFFDEQYLQLWKGWLTPDRTAREADGLWALLTLSPGTRVLDAPCGYGRMSRALAERGAIVTGVDQSAPMIAQAEAERGAIDPSRLRYVEHDLRAPLAPAHGAGFDVALNIFSSIGYGSEDEDLAVFRTLVAALRPGGRLFVETNHRDFMVATLVGGAARALRLPDGTLVIEEPRFEPLAGRVESTWYWSGPAGAGQKSASMRLYTITELAALLTRAGLRVLSLHAGCTPEPFVAAGPTMGGRVGVLAER